jgi:hypothetical protein
VTAWQAHRCEPEIVPVGPRGDLPEPRKEVVQHGSRRQLQALHNATAPAFTGAAPPKLASPGDLRNLSEEEFRPWYSAAQAEYQRRRRRKFIV